VARQNHQFAANRVLFRSPGFAGVLPEAAAEGALEHGRSRIIGRLEEVAVDVQRDRGRAVAKAAAVCQRAISSGRRDQLWGNRLWQCREQLSQWRQQRTSHLDDRRDSDRHNHIGHTLLPGAHGGQRQLPLEALGRQPASPHSEEVKEKQWISVHRLPPKARCYCSLALYLRLLGL
jgi:hypothetical protein